MPPTKKTFEEQLERLQEITELLESESLPLAESLALYKEGIQLTNSCHEQLNSARNEIAKLSEGVFVPFKEIGNEPDKYSGPGNDEE